MCCLLVPAPERAEARCISVSFAVCPFCCRTVFSRCGAETDLSPEAACWDPSLGRHLSAKQGFCFHYTDIYLPGNGQAPQTKIIRHGPLRAVKLSGLRLPAESVTGTVSGHQSSAITQRQHPKTRAELSPAAPAARRNLVNFCNWFSLGVCGKGCASSPGCLS